MAIDIQLYIIATPKICSMNVAPLNHEFSVHFSLTNMQLCDVDDFVLETAYFVQISHLPDFVFQVLNYYTKNYYAKKAYKFSKKTSLLFINISKLRQNCSS